LPQLVKTIRASVESESLRAAARSSDLKSVLGEKRLNKVLRIIKSQPACSVSELALEVHLSPAHLQRLFKQKTGLHVRDLIGEQRLIKAAHLLRSSDLPIKEIAYAVGYLHHSSFVRAFQRRFAQPPKFYRRENYSARSDSLQLVERAAAD
jgi:transcriptional regulator GlxA family with amidase domain